MTRMIDVLEDYCLFRGWGYCRIDGNTSGDDRENMIDDFNRPVGDIPTSVGKRDSESI